MSARDAAAYLDITVDGLAKLIREDRTFPVHRLGNGPRAHRRFYRSELDRWLTKRCRTATSGATAQAS
jgi:excisionase family DNA binding protein